MSSRGTEAISLNYDLEERLVLLYIYITDLLVLTPLLIRIRKQNVRACIGMWGEEKGEKKTSKNA